MEAQTLKAVALTTGTAYVGDVIRAAMRAWLEATRPELLTPDLFIGRAVARRVKWPTLHEDVWAWHTGQRALDSFLQPGKSRSALLVRFAGYAKAQGWRNSRDGRTGPAKEVLRRWLEQGHPSPRNREIAEAFLNATSLDDAGIKLGLSRQRVSQVLQIAKRQVAMAERVGSFPSPKIEFAIKPEWLDGAVWQVMEGVDYTKSAQNASQKLYTYARENGYLVKTQRTLDGKGLCFQFFKKAGA